MYKLNFVCRKIYARAADLFVCTRGLICLFARAADLLVYGRSLLHSTAHWHSGYSTIGHHPQKWTERQTWLLKVTWTQLTMISGSMTSGNRITLNSDKATKALLAVRSLPVNTKMANVVTATYRKKKHISSAWPIDKIDHRKSLD